MKRFFYLILILITASFFSSCDYTSELKKLIIKAQENLSYRNYKKALGYYEQILEKSPSAQIQIKILFQMSEIYSIYDNNPKLAVATLKKVLKLADRPVWHVKATEKIADLYFSILKNYDKSEIWYFKLLQFYPRLKKASFYEYRYGVSSLLASNLDLAIKTFNSIISNSKHGYYHDTFYYLGMAYFWKKQWGQSIKIWKDALRYEKSSARKVVIKFMLANAYEESENFSDAYHYYYLVRNDYPISYQRLNSLFTRKIARRR